MSSLRVVSSRFGASFVVLLDFLLIALPCMSKVMSFFFSAFFKLCSSFIVHFLQNVLHLFSFKSLISLSKAVFCTCSSLLFSLSALLCVAWCGIKNLLPSWNPLLCALRLSLAFLVCFYCIFIRAKAPLNIGLSMTQG